MSSAVVQANYDELDAVARRFGQQAQGIGELRRRLQRSAQILEQGGWQGRGSAAFFGELNTLLVPATQRLAQALDEARTVTLEIRGLLLQAEQEAAAPFRGQATATASAGNGQAVDTGTAEAEEPSGMLIAAGLAADLTPVVGELKGLAEIFTGKDLVTGEELGWWRFAGILGIVGLNEVKLLRHVGKVADAARSAGALQRADKIIAINRESLDEIAAGKIRHIGDKILENPIANRAYGRLQHHGVDVVLDFSESPPASKVGQFTYDPTTGRNVVDVFMRKHSKMDEVISTIVHESSHAHRRFKGIGSGTQYEEYVSTRLEFLYNNLRRPSFDERNAIWMEVKKLYPKLPEGKNPFH